MLDLSVALVLPNKINVSIYASDNSVCFLFFFFPGSVVLRVCLNFQTVLNIVVVCKAHMANFMQVFFV